MKEFNKMAVAELRQYAAENNIALDGATLKKDILSKIEAAADMEGAPPATGSTDDTQPPEDTPPASGNTGAGQPPAADTEGAPPATGSTDDTQPPEDTPPASGNTGAGQPPAADMEGAPPATGSTDGTQPPASTPPEASDTGAGQPPFVIDRVLKVTKPLLKGDDVKAVQGALIANGFHCGIEGASGTYEKYTAYAVRCFQAARRLIVDGKAGRYTVTALGGKWNGEKLKLNVETK